MPAESRSSPSGDESACASVIDRTQAVRVLGDRKNCRFLEPKRVVRFDFLRASLRRTFTGSPVKLDWLGKSS